MGGKKRKMESESQRITVLIFDVPQTNQEVKSLALFSTVQRKEKKASEPNEEGTTAG